MACYYPLEGYRARYTNPKSGKRPITFNPNAGYKDMPVTVPCGQCIGCRIDRSRSWALRCVHEASLHQENSFITLTYNPEHLPRDLSLHKEHFQKFMKRLRDHLSPTKVRFYHCGEYGDENRRPHYHALLFGFYPPDAEHYATRNGVKLYKSPMIDKIWGMGFVTVGDVTYESAAYVARYVMKKVMGKGKETIDDNGLKPYELIDKTNGEIIEIEPEYTTMSLRPAIGKDWIENNLFETYRDDYLIHSGRKLSPPKYYDEVLQGCHEELYDRVKARRKNRAKNHAENNTRERLEKRAAVHERRLTKLVRNL